MINGVIETTIDGVTFGIGRLPPKRAIHVAAKLAPFLGVILPQLHILFAKGESGDSPTQEEFLERTKNVLPPIATALAKMPAEDIDMVLDTCLGVVQIRQERGWAPVMTNGNLMFQNIGIKTMLQLAAAVIKENMADFFPMSPPQESTTKPSVTQ